MIAKSPELFFRRVEPVPRVVITGAGVIFPDANTNDGSIIVCIDTEDFNLRLRRGQSIIGKMPGYLQERLHFGPNDPLIGAFFPHDLQPLKEYLPKELTAKLKEPRASSAAQLASVAINQSITSAGLNKSLLDPADTGVAIASSIGPEHIEAALREFFLKEQYLADPEAGKKDPGHRLRFKQAYTALTGNGLPDELPRIVAKVLGLYGTVINDVAACASGVSNILAATDAIRNGYARAMLAGGVEDPRSIAWLETFRQANVATTQFNNRPQEGSRPGDKDRSGLVPSSGASVVFLERLDQVINTGREDRILAEVLYGATSIDVQGITVSDNHLATEHAYEMTLARSGVREVGTDITLPHMSSTLKGDQLESEVIYKYNPNSVVYPVREPMGHQFAASGGSNVLAGLLFIRDGVVPKRSNLHTPGTIENGILNPTPLAQLRWGDGVHREYNSALAFGIGMQGINAGIIFIRYSPYSPF